MTNNSFSQDNIISVTYSSILLFCQASYKLI